MKVFPSSPSRGIQNGLSGCTCVYLRMMSPNFTSDVVKLTDGDESQHVKHKAVPSQRDLCQTKPYEKRSGEPVNSKPEECCCGFISPFASSGSRPVVRIVSILLLQRPRSFCETVSPVKLAEQLVQCMFVVSDFEVFEILLRTYIDAASTHHAPIVVGAHIRRMCCPLPFWT